MQTTLNFIGKNVLEIDMHSAYDVVANIFGFKTERPMTLKALKDEYNRATNNGETENCRVLSLCKRNSEDFYEVSILDDSMIDEQIARSEIVLVRRTSEAQSGDIILAVVDGVTTLKRYKKFHDRIELHSAGSDFQSIQLTDESDFRVAGVFAGHLHTHSAD